MNDDGLVGKSLSVTKFHLNLLFGVLTIILLAGCDAFLMDQTATLPANLPLKDIDQLGVGPIAWIEPNDLIFLYDLIGYPTIIRYQVDTGETETIELPNITIFPTVSLSADGKYIGYSNDFGGLSVLDVVTGNQMDKIEGSEMAFSKNGEFTVVWDNEFLYSINLKTGGLELISQIDSQKFNEENLRSVDTAIRPNTSQIAFILTDLNSESMDSLVMVDQDSTEHQITAHKDILGFSWSPDGEYLVYSYGSSGFNSLLVIVDMKRNCPILELGYPQEAFPLWSPDGQSIFLYKDSDGTEIMKIDDYFEGSLKDQPCIGN